MKVHIPNSAFLGNINSFVLNIDPTDSATLQITTNPMWMSIHPVVLAMIAALGKPLKSTTITCDDILASSGHYLKRMGLFDFLNIHPKVKDIEEHEPSGRIIPLTQIKSSDELEDFLKNLVPLLHLQTKPKYAQAIQHIFSELIRNVLEHAYSSHGAIVCAQYFKKTNRIAIGVADTGIGLKKALSYSHPVTDNLRAIQLALTPGITGTTSRPGGTEQNAGFGLFLIKSIALASLDFFIILSGDKMYKLLKRRTKKKKPIKRLQLNNDPLEDRHSILTVPPWQGVVVGVDISLDQTGEFNLLLDAIHEFYIRDVKGKKKERYKKPKFI
jgi:anti-sigma regulatory factor (Ser/Thr protein kinase)